MKYTDTRDMVVTALLQLLNERAEELHRKAEAQRQAWLQGSAPEERYDPALFARLTGRNLKAGDRVRCVEAIRKMIDEGYVQPIGAAWAAEENARKRLCWVRLTRKGVELAQELAQKER
jgi:hypothetical protein